MDRLSQEESSGAMPSAVKGTDNKRGTTGATSSCSIVPWGSSTRFYVVTEPSTGDDVISQASSALVAMRASLPENASLLRLVVYSDDVQRPESREAVTGLVQDSFGAGVHAVTFVHQPPASGSLCSLEGWAVANANGGGLPSITRPGPGVVVLDNDGVREVHVSGVVASDSVKGGYEEARQAYSVLKDTFAHVGCELADIVRIWHYLRDITGPDEGPDRQRYLGLNRGRAESYESVTFGRGLIYPAFKGKAYPASTGIGVSNGTLTITAKALKTDRKDVFVCPIENKLQTPVHQYGTEYSPRRPKFARGLVEIVGDKATIYISGTASIRQSRTVYPDSVDAQTRATIDNIETLISDENLRWQGISGLGATPGDAAQVHVYVKNPADYPVVKGICRDRFGDVPVIYTIADICRPPLLVEIEAVVVPPSMRS